jgi:peptidoglycan/xylan/chitin deacetylase (PgdA/CDA1 family)
VFAVRNRFSSSDLVLAVLGLRSLYNNIALVAAIENKRGVRSSFYVLTSNYNLGKISAELAKLAADGWEVGLHGEFGTHDSKEKMEDDISRFKKALGFNPAGVREHFLRFDFENTWRLASDAGFAYDTTTGARDTLGFRIGLCTPFHPPGEDWAPMKLLELPLVLMDTTLWGYLKLSEEDGLTRTRGLISLVRATGGLFTLLWHQESLRMKGGRIYPQILDDLVADGAWVANANAVTSWWNGRAVPLQRRGDTYLLSGGAPRGLCLEVFAREGLIPSVKGGAVERVGDRFLVRVQSGDFVMEMR